MVIFVKMSNRTRYGMRAMLHLALFYSGNRPVPAREIADRNKIPENFLEQLLRILRKQGLVESIRGSQGGYVLGREPHDIKVSEIINALEGPISLADCLEVTPCQESYSCPSRRLWSRIKDSIEKVTETTTLEDLIVNDLSDKEGELQSNDQTCLS